MRKWELLKYAYDNYPKGTNFIAFSRKGEAATSSGNFKFSQNSHQGFWITDVETYYVVYSPNAEWAEIVKEEAKEIEQQLYFGQVAFINLKKSEVRIIDVDKEVSTLSFGDINDLSVNIADALKQLS